MARMLTVIEAAAAMGVGVRTLERKIAAQEVRVEVVYRGQKKLRLVEVPDNVPPSALVPATSGNQMTELAELLDARESAREAKQLERDRALFGALAQLRADFTPLLPALPPPPGSVVRHGGILHRLEPDSADGTLCGRYRKRWEPASAEEWEAPTGARRCRECERREP